MTRSPKNKPDLSKISLPKSTANAPAATVYPRDPLLEQEENSAEDVKRTTLTASERAEHFAQHLLDKCYEDIEILRAEIASHVTKCDELRKENRDLQDVRVELAGLKSPRKLIKWFTGVFALTTGLGTAAVTKFPQDANVAFWTLKNATCFSAGIIMLVLAALLGLVLAIASP